MSTQTIGDETSTPAVADAPVIHIDTSEEQPREEPPECSNVTSIPKNAPSTTGLNSRAARPGWASHAPGALLLLGAGYLVVKLVKAFRQQQHELAEACRQLRSAQEHLTAKEQALEETEARRKTEQDARVAELSQQMADAQRELATTRDMCRQAALKVEQSMSGLSVMDTELRAARAQLKTASRDLALKHAQLEATEGELGLTRSQNELMKREVDILRRQLREAGQQLEGYIMVSRGRKNAAAAHHDYEYDDTRTSRADLEDDLAAAATADWGCL